MVVHDRCVDRSVCWHSAAGKRQVGQPIPKIRRPTAQALDPGRIAGNKPRAFAVNSDPRALSFPEQEFYL